MGSADEILHCHPCPSPAGPATAKAAGGLLTDESSIHLLNEGLAVFIPHSHTMTQPVSPQIYVNGPLQSRKPHLWSQDSSHPCPAADVPAVPTFFQAIQSDAPYL